MGTQENIKVVQDLMQAVRDRDEARYIGLFVDDAVVRAAGVPRALGGVSQGREEILQNFRQLPPGQAELRDIFADDSHVCAVQKLSSTFTATQHFRGSGKPFTTYQCQVFRLEGGRIREQTIYANFLDVYVQAGMVSLESLRA